MGVTYTETKKEYRPLIVAGRVSGTGYAIDGRVLYWVQWDYDKGEFWHLYGWDAADDNAVMETMYAVEKEARAEEASATGKEIPIVDWVNFARAWKEGKWKPLAEFVVPSDVVEVVEVKQKEVRDEKRDQLIANGFDISPRKSTDVGGILCLPMEKNLNGDIKAKHPDWELIECPNCGRGCWTNPEAEKLKQEQGVQFLCTECALEAGLVRPYPQSTPKPGGNRAQRRAAKRKGGKQ